VIWEFNLALISCVLDEFMTFFKDFRQTKRYHINNPYKVPMPFEKEDVILHLSILFSGVFAFLVKHPDSPIVGFITVSPMILAGILLVLLIFAFQAYAAIKSQKSDQHENDDRSDKEKIMEHVKEIQKPGI
jgi:hypothetical protein